MDPFSQCIAFDRHFSEIADSIDSVNAYVNRAFALATARIGDGLWGKDHAHTSERGAYLAVCVFFATVFGASSEVLGTNGLPTEDARFLQKIADRVALSGEIPW